MKFNRIITIFSICIFCVQIAFAQKSTSKATVPGEVFSLLNWKLTIPIKNEGSANPVEIKQPQLNTYASEYFFLNKNKDAISFKANTGGETTSGSNFPRSELREMLDDGKTPAAWSSSEGKHTLIIDQRVVHLPEVRPQIVIGQIHDADKYLIFFRLEGKKLLVSANGADKVVLDADYNLGKRFTVKFVVQNNRTECYYNNELKYTFESSFSGAYFKAGAYVQSSCKGKKKTEGESCDAYGEVEIFNVWVKHEN